MPQVSSTCLFAEPRGVYQAQRANLETDNAVDRVFRYLLFDTQLRTRALTHPE